MIELSAPRFWKRHLIVVLLLVIAWQFLQEWYFYQNHRSYLFFLLTGSAAAGLALSSYVTYLRCIPTLRLPFVLLLLIASLPWADWLQLSTFISREDWSRQLFLQSAFLYAVLLLFEAVREIPLQICKRALQALNFLSRKSYVFVLFPFLFFVFCSAISLFVYQQTPVVQDSSAHLFQAKIFAAGHLFAPVPPVPDFFSLSWDMLVMKDARWFGMYQPGFALLLAAAMMLQVEWFVSPLLGALTILLWLSYAKRWQSANVAVLFGLLAIFSPFLVLMCSSIMVFTPELFVASAAIYLCRSETEESKVSRSFLLFVVLLSEMLVRSFSSLPFLAPVLGYTCWKLLRSRRFLTPACILLGIFAGTSLLLLYQWKTTGNPFLPGYLLEYPDVGLGFGQHWIGSHTPLKSLENLSNSLLGLNYWLSGWYSGSIFFVILFFAFASKIEKWDVILALCCCGLAAFYFFFLFQDLFFGPRYYFPLAPILLLFVARSAFDLQRLRRPVIALLIVSFFLFFPSRFKQFITKYDVSQKVSGYLKKEIRKAGSEKILVFLDRNVQNFFVNWNDPFLRSNVVICRDFGSRNREAIEAFSRYRPVYFRLDSRIEKGNVRSGYYFFDDPDPNPPGYVSHFQLASAILSANDYPDRDCFDICYEDLFNAPEAAEQIKYLKQESERQIDGPEYKRNFRLGLAHAGLLMLLPKKAFEEKGLNWRSSFSSEAFRAELEQATNRLTASGDVGSSVLFQLQRVAKRIDQNQDEILSDDEIVEYLKHKIDILTFGG